jgi:hypothetical protein
MTPTLLGRWTTRLLLFVFIGLPVTFLWGLYLENWSFPPPTSSDSLFVQAFVFLTLILILGLVLDVLYMQIQRFHWDQDWPFAYQFFFSILEFLIVYYAICYEIVDYVFEFRPRPTFNAAACHFSLVFIPSFLALLGGIQIFLVRWRFKGGELGRLPIQ